MNALLALWLPILLSAVFVFLASSLIHMVFKWHNSDYHGLANEDAVREAIRAGQPEPGLYVLPYCSDMKEMSGETMGKKYDEGPVGYLNLAPNGRPKMAVALARWFVLNLAVAVIAAFVVTQIFGLAPWRGRAAAKLVGVLCFAAYGFGSIQEGIWMAKPWKSVAKSLLDAVIYALVSGLTFYVLWPD